MDKSEAERAALELWRELPPQNRSDLELAVEFARLIAHRLPFETLGNHDKIVAAWFIRDVQHPDDHTLVHERHDGLRQP